MPGEEVGSAYATIGIKIDEAGLNAAQGKISGAVRGIESGMGGLKSSLGSELSASLSGVASSMGPIGGALSAIGPAGIAAGAGIAVIGGALSSSVQAAASFETSMSGVAKTTGLAGPELSALGSSILEMSSTMPVAASELANIAQVAGSLGVAKEELAGFSEVAAQMSVAFEMPAEQAATAAAKILTAFGMDIDTSNMESLGNVVNTMGDSFAATEPEVLDFINRASFLNTTMGQSIPQVAALGTALISAGMSSETASTGIKSFLNMATSVTANKDNLTSWATLLGTSVDELKGKLAGDLNGTLAETAQKIAAIEDPTERFQAAVKLAGTEGAPAILKLAAAGDTLQSAL
ncbi:MAG: phage tail tape measure protein, partial [Acidobacteria bacterium]|nr:phage tail tape measure protein [Acidobacteriota bacterium]